MDKIVSFRTISNLLTLKSVWQGPDRAPVFCKMSQLPGYVKTYKDKKKILDEIHPKLEGKAAAFELKFDAKNFGEYYQKFFVTKEA